jgi:hypothetical protein
VRQALPQLLDAVHTSLAIHSNGLKKAVN